MLPKLPLAKLTTLIVFFLIFCFFSGLQSNQVTQVAAQEAQETPTTNALIGTHLGEGDITFQAGIMDMLSSNGAEAGFPVTVMVSVNSPLSDLQTLSASVTRNGFFPIVRINGVCEDGDAARIIRDIKTAFGGDIPIEYGNEVNNKEVECADYQKYANEYAQIRSQPNVGPAALDFYNSKDLASNFISQVGNFAGDDVYFANAYGCIGDTIDTCDVATTETQVDGYKDVPGGPIYLTEFSLSPGGDSNAPDTDLKKVVEFIQTRVPGPESGIAAITPLIRNVCNDDGTWLLYLNGKVFTRNGAEVDPETCSSSSDKAPFYLYQIESLKEAIQQSLPAKAAAADIAGELIDQGYEVSCTAPEGLFKTELGNWDDYEKHIDPSLQSLPTRELGFSQQVDYTSVRYPLFRGVSKASSTNDSIEAHFGYLDTDEKLSQAEKETKSGAIYKLLTTEQQCQYQKNILATIDAMCNKLEDPESCALYQNIPHSEYTTKSLYPVAQNLDCTTQGRTEALERDKSGVVAAQYKALQNTPLYLDKAFRLGFVVFTAQQRASIDLEQGNGWDFLFNREENPGGDPEDEVRVVAFKLPDTGTNKNINSDIYYDDPLIITRDALTSTNDQERRKETFAEGRAAFKKDAAVASQIDFPTNQALVNCSGPVCNDPLGRALVNLLNSGNTNFDSTCGLDEETRQEKLARSQEANSIGVAGGLNVQNIEEQPTAPENGLGTFFKNSFQVLTNLFRQPEEADQSPQAFELEGTAKINPDQLIKGTYIPEAKFNTYLIYPVGYELDQVTKSLASTIKNADQITDLEDDPQYDPYFMLSGIDQQFESDTPTESYVLAPGQGDCAAGNEIDPETGLQKGCQKEIQYEAVSYLNDFDGDDNVDSIDPEPRIKGGLLGNIMRDIQLSLRQVGSDGWDYLRSCENTEDFLLNNCE